jgi:hypothetical protein
VQGDALLALALVHHLAIGRNIPLTEAVNWIVGLAPRGLIEFVPKHDPTVQRMLELREDVFADYSQETFEIALRDRALIRNATPVSASGRIVFQYERA